MIMVFTREIKDGSSIVKFDGGLTVYEASAIRDELLKCLDAHDSLTLDLSSVCGCDLTGVQLLYSTRLAAEAEDKSFAIRGATADVIEAITQLGLEPGEVLHVGNEE